MLVVRLVLFTSHLLSLSLSLIFYSLLFVIISHLCLFPANSLERSTLSGLVHTSTSCLLHQPKCLAWFHVQNLRWWGVERGERLGVRGVFSHLSLFFVFLCHSHTVIIGI